MDKILAELLLKRGLIKKDRLKAALMEQSVTKERLGKILVRNGFLRQEKLFLLLREINPNALHDEGMFHSSIPQELLLKTNTMVVALIEDTLFVSTLSSPVMVRRLIEPYTRGYKVAFTAANPVRMQEYLTQLRTTEDQDMLTWERLFYDAMRMRCSDIHILPRHASYTVEYRHDGVLNLAHEGTRDEYISLVSRVKDLAKMDMAERRRPQDGGFQKEFSGRLVQFRVATSPTVDGETMVIRILDPDSVNLQLEDLGITRLDVWKQGIARPNGMCLVCGPTGSGKTTTLAATARSMNFLERAIFTVEDPVEARIPYARQINVNMAVHLGFAEAVRAFMRQDPDVIITGEVRDIDTARNALKAGETGHLSLGTLHTNSIVSTFGRLRDIGVQAYELRDLLRAVMVQGLIRVFCTECRGKGCAFCNDTGYRGRAVVSEAAYFPDAEAVEAAWKGHVTWPTIQQDAKLLVQAGRTSEAEFQRVFGIPMSEVKDYVA